MSWRVRIEKHLSLQNGVLLFAGVIVVGSLWTTVSTLQKNYILQRELDDLTRRVEFEDVATRTLELESQYYRSQEYLEVSAREKLGKASPGEKVLILPAQPQQATSTSPGVFVGTTSDAVPASNFQQWMRFLFGSNGQG